MSNPERPEQAGVPELPPSSAVERLTGAVAILGGLLTLAVAVLATVSVLMRWLLNAPIDGDFEYVKMVTAIAIFAYLPYTQAQRGNIMVDTFTGRLPPRMLSLIDAFWDLVFAALMAYLSYCLVFGTLAAIQSGETTMQRQLVLWPSIALCTALAILLVVTCIATAVRLLGTNAGRGRS